LGWIIATIILLAIAALLKLKGRSIGVALVDTSRNQSVIDARMKSAGDTSNMICTIAAIVLVFIWLIVTIASSVHTIPAGEVGVVRSFGKINSQIPEGLQLTWPWQTVEKWNIRLQTVLPESNCSDGTQHCMDAFSSETQDVFIRATINLSVDPKDVQELARTVGSNYIDRLVLPRLHQIVKDATVAYKSVDIAPNREAIRQKIRQRLADELRANSINVIDLLITNIDFRPEFKASIEAKVKAEQDALAEQNKIQVAKAQAEQVSATAQGAADKLRIEAQGQADANRLISESLTPELIQFQAIQKFNDNVQIVLVPSGEGNLLDPSTFLRAAQNP
jgi:regulator of protease activity HflC (stomatin/prohibitin superfamily)